MQIGSQFLVSKQGMYLLMAGRANVYGRPQVLTVTFVFAFGMLPRDEVMLSKLRAVATTQLTNRHSSLFAWDDLKALICLF